MWSFEKDVELVSMFFARVRPVVAATYFNKTEEECISHLQVLKESHRRYSEEARFVMSKHRTCYLRLLFPTSKVKHLMGAKGVNFESIKRQSRATLTLNTSHIGNYTGEVTETILSISANEVSELHSPLEEAAFLSFACLCDASSGAHSLKIVVDEASLECVDPFYISKTEAVTEANIIVKDYGRSGIILEIWGNFEAVRKAFVSVVLRLRKHNFKLSSEELASGLYVSIDPTCSASF